MISEPVVDGRRVESLVQELRAYAPHYTPDLNLSDEQSVGAGADAHLRAARRDGARPPRSRAAEALRRVSRSASASACCRRDRRARRSRSGSRQVSNGTGSRAGRHARDGARRAERRHPVRDDRRADGDSRCARRPRTASTPHATRSSARRRVSWRRRYGRRPSSFTRCSRLPPPDRLALQLDHVTELTPGRVRPHRLRATSTSFARSTTATSSRSSSRSRATCPTDTRVTPIRDFEVFNGIDLQEHVLYIGHADSFTVKDRGRDQCSTCNSVGGAAPSALRHRVAVLDEGRQGMHRTAKSTGTT